MEFPPKFGIGCRNSTFPCHKALCFLFIQNHGINLLGVNTRSDRESSPGYKDNYVKCSCSELAIFNVVKDLEAIGAVRIKVGMIMSVLWDVAFIRLY